MGVLTVTGCVGEGNRVTVVNTLRTANVDEIVTRTNDPVLIELVRRVTLHTNKRLVNLPVGGSVDGDVWVFGVSDCEEAEERMHRLNRYNVRLLRLII